MQLPYYWFLYLPSGYDDTGNQSAVNMLSRENTAVQALYQAPSFVVVVVVVIVVVLLSLHNTRKWKSSIKRGSVAIILMQTEQLKRGRHGNKAN